ncbi:hypothetical protein ACLB2K_003329 [Fragaria x ananassa]
MGLYSSCEDGIEMTNNTLGIRSRSPSGLVSDFPIVALLALTVSIDRQVIKKSKLGNISSSGDTGALIRLVKKSGRAPFSFLIPVNGGYMKYNTSSGVVEGKLNVHLVAHSHDDVGWLKAVDQYYVGSNNSIQAACIENVLDSVVESLFRDRNRKFVFAEMTTLGHRAIKEQFNKAPRAGGQIDPFGHSAVQAYLLGAELGFDSVHFARIDYQDREKRKKDKSLEVIWQGSRTLGSSCQIFANAFPVHYGPPSGFRFEINGDFIPIQDNPLLYDSNIEERVNDFINAAATQANVTRTNHIMWTMGGDFEYQYAESWFKEMDKLIHYVNKDDRVNALYSTPSLYTDAKNAANQSWPLKNDDYFPYADAVHTYWTSFFTSRPSLKRYVRMLSGYYLAARQLEFLVGKRSTGPNTFSLGDALGIAHHHDAVSGTSKEHTTSDYAKRLPIGASEAESVVSAALSCLTAVSITQYQLLPSNRGRVPEGKSLVVVAYNPLGWNITVILRIPVNDSNLAVQDYLGNSIEAQFISLDNVTLNIRNFYTNAYLGVSSKQVPKVWLIFQVSVPPLGWNTYFISRRATKGNNTNGFFSVMDSPQNETIEVGPGDLKMSFSVASGQLKRMYNPKTGVDVPIQQSFLWYNSSSEFPGSGAYLFRPSESVPKDGSRSVHLKVFRGPLVDEIHQEFSSWIYQVTRLYRDKQHAEVEFTIDPIPTEDYTGREVITRMTTNMTTDKVFYTDSNGRDFIKRVRDYRADWSLSVNEPVAGNYYPLNLRIFTSDKKYEFSVLVDRATGGASIKDGEVELMLHRRVLFDEAKGVEEALDEIVCIDHSSICKGLMVRGNYYMNINKLGEGARWRRKTGQEIYSPLVLAFTHENLENWTASHLSKASTMDSNYSLPQNVALITLQELDDGSVLVRLAHLYEIKEVKEVSLSANQDKSEMKRMEWKVEGNNNTQPIPVRGGPVHNSTLVFELGSMEIRTFLLKF